MAERDFWRAIGIARRGSARRGSVADLNRQLGTPESALRVRRLERLLEDREVREVLAFHRALAAVHRRAYRWDLWTAFGIALGGIDRWQFRDAVSWLLLRGGRQYRRALAAPDVLARWDVDDAEIAGAGAVTTVVHRVLDPADTRNLAAAIGGIDPPDRPWGHLTEADFPLLRRRFPRLTARHLPGGPGGALFHERPFAWQARR
ncbi:DUF4240 domain-containing protein [Amycolatopsis minnesotensis]|uniref:DUF4240 domain-containing protein n=1 Tax=Amycolatopsis minnesotensis TaxID=337894 RepID=A0ABN2QGK1_9PSEU